MGNAIIRSMSDLLEEIEDEVPLNRDLIGFEFEGEFGPVKVTDVAYWNSAYVEVESLDGKLRSVRPAGHVRLLRDARHEKDLDDRDKPDPVGPVVDGLSSPV